MRLIDKVEAVLFIADSPLTADYLASLIGVPIFEVEDVLERLGGKLQNNGPLQLIRIAGGFQVCTKPEYADLVAQFLQPQKHKLSRSLLEVLAVVAYRQPITMGEIDEIRGVQSDYGLRQLVEKRLVVEIGRKSSPGRPLLYGTTQQFLHTFNLQSLEELPDIFGRKAFEAIGSDLPPEQPALPTLESETGGLVEEEGAD
ncbi:MAG: SMC-Scp complex subunit ScpB [Fimbriimonadaceae bacterium]|jgi:segregation and condensation protein B|nr:SMC-Scp complex subunit ScpB [Fimbriimonadaceae bacterium]